MASRARQGLVTLGDQSILFAAAVRGIFQRPFYLAEFLEQCRFVLFSCFVPLMLTGLGWGTIVALEAGNFFKLASAEWRIGGFMVLANVREFAPVATGLMVAAVCGTAITADLGARKVRDELEALSVMGISNILFIVVPRFLALAVMTALYNVPMIVFTCLSGYLASVALVGVNSGAFISTFFTQGTLQDLYGGEIKCVVFGMIIATICCYKGITARGGAEGVARAVHQAVVACFVSIQIFEYLYTPTVLALFHTNNVLR
ncbi:MAG: ABC transporter permease [Chloroflexi bacterium]|nr:ABC transporter permease [Chloroflexota bacterium]